MKTPNVTLIKGGPGSGPRKGGGRDAALIAAGRAQIERTNAMGRASSGGGSGGGAAAVLSHVPASVASPADHQTPVIAAPSSPGAPGSRQTADSYSSDAHAASHEANSNPSAEAHRKAASAHDHAYDYHSAAHGGDKSRLREHANASDHHRKEATKYTRMLAPKGDLARFHKGDYMSNEVSDLFKSELGDTDVEKAITKCVHCKHDLSKSDLRKGLGANFVADDNDNPHDGSETGQVDPSRGVPGAKENDEIAPLLKGLKGADAGLSEEFPIHKSEMVTMGMNAEDLDDGWYTITKSEMQKQAPDHLAYLADRKSRVMKSMKPAVNTLRKSDDGNARSATDGPHGYSPRAGGVHGAAGEQLVQWSPGSDAEVAKYIEKSGGYGPGTDESIRTQGRGY